MLSISLTHWKFRRVTEIGLARLSGNHDFRPGNETKLVHSVIHTLLMAVHAHLKIIVGTNIDNIPTFFFFVYNTLCNATDTQ